jgi:hypothetical protein
VIQSLDRLPDGYGVPKERVKPWGTAHAVLMAREVIEEPFAVINADDFYGRSSYQIIHDFLIRTTDEMPGQYCMVGYELQKTVSEHGSVARGVCRVDDHGFLQGMVERTKIFLLDDNIVFEDEDGKMHPLDPMDTVSMNLFGFTPDFFSHIEDNFKRFLDANIDNPKAELYIPYVVDNLIKEGRATMSVLKTSESWFGVTYQEDKPKVLRAIQELVNSGKYPGSLWD